MEAATHRSRIRRVVFGVCAGVALATALILVVTAGAATLSATNATGVNVARMGCLETMTCGTGFAAGLGGDDFEPQLAADSGVSGGVDHSRFVYQSWSHFVNKTASTIFFSMSSDGGQTWSTPAELPGQPSLAGRNDDARLWVDPATHTVYLTFLTYSNAKGDIYLARSSDRGATWTYTQVNTAVPNVTTSCGSARGQVGCDLHQVVASGSNVWVAMGPMPGAGSVRYMASSNDGGATFSTVPFATGVTEYFVQPVGGGVESSGADAWFLWGDCRLPAGATSCEGTGGGSTRFTVSKTTGAGAGAASVLSPLITSSPAYPGCPIPTNRGGCSVDGSWGQPAAFAMDANNNLYMAYVISPAAGSVPTIHWRSCLGAATNCGPAGVSGWVAGAQVSDTPAGFYAIQPRISVRAPNAVDVTWLDDRNGSTTACPANAATGDAPHTCGWRVYHRTSSAASSPATAWTTTRDLWAYNALTDAEVGAGFFWPYGDTGAAVITNRWAGNQPMALWSEAARYSGNQGHMLVASPAPYGVTGLTAAGGYREVQLDWTASTQTNAGAITYAIYRGTSPTTATTHIATVAGTSYLDAGATSDLTTYHYKVVPVSATNGAGFPALASATTVQSATATFSASGLGADATGTVLTVNGTNYTAAQLPVTLTRPKGSTVTYAWSNTATTASGTKRYALTTPAPSPASPFVINADTTVTGTYKTQVQVTFAAPTITTAGDSGAATVFTAGGVAQPASALGSAAWYDVGTAWSFADPVATADADKRYALSAPTSGTLSAADAGTTKTGNYGVQWRPTFSVTGVGGDTGANVVATIAGTGYPASSFPVSVWLPTGSAWSYASPVATSPASDTRYRRTSPASGTVTSAAPVAGTYVLQYRTTFDVSGIGGDTGTNTVVTVSGTGYSKGQLPVVGFFDTGSAWSYASPVATSPASDTRYRRSSTAGGTIGQASAGTTITGTYVTQHRLTFSAPTLAGDTGTEIVFSVGGSDFTAAALGSAFYDAGAAWNFAPTVAAGTDKRYALAVPTSGTVSAADAGTTKTGTYGVQWHVTFSATGFEGDTGANAVLSVGGSDRSAGQLPDTAWVPNGTGYTWNTPVDTSPVSPRVYNLTSAPATGSVTSGAPITATYEPYDPAAPVTSIDSGPPSVTLDTSATFTFSSDIVPATYQCRLDAGAWSSCTSPQAYVGLSLGSHTFSVRATANGGVTDPAPPSWTWTVAAVIPDTTIDSGPDAATEDTSATFAFSSDEPGATFECRLDAGAWSSCASPKSYAGLALGPHTFDVRAVVGGIADQSPASWGWSVASIVPVTTIDTGPDDPTLDTSATFTFSSDQPGSTFECRLDAGAWSSCTSPKTSAGLALGSHTFRARATFAGVTDPTPAAWTWNVVAVIPDTDILTGPADPTTSTSATFTFSSPQPGSTFECRLDAGTWSGCSSPKNYAGLALGPHSVAVRATASGVTDPTPATWSWQIVPVIPDTQIDSGPSGTSTSVEAAFTFSSDEPAATFQCRLDANPWSSCASPKVYAGLDAGSHTFDVRAVLGGQSDPTPASRTWTVDPPIPGTQLESGPVGTTLDRGATFTFSSDQPSATFDCRLDAGAWQVCSSPQDYVGLAIGPHTFEVRASLGGVKDPSPSSRSWVIDPTIPDTSIDVGPDGTTTDTGATFQFSSDQPSATFECRLDAGTWGPCASPQVLTSLSPGAHGFAVRAVLDGYPDPFPPSRTWTVADAIALTQIDTGPSGTTASRTATFTFTSDQPSATFECRLDAGPWGPCVSPVDYTSLPMGEHTFFVRAVLAGVYDPLPPSRTWKIVAPTDTSLTIKAPSRAKAGARVRISGALASADSACVAGQQVALNKGPKVVASTATLATGMYRFQLKITRRTTVQVSFAGTGTCAPSASRKLTIRAT